MKTATLHTITVGYICPKDKKIHQAKVDIYDFSFNTSEEGYSMNDYLRVDVFCKNCKKNHTVSIR